MVSYTTMAKRCWFLSIVYISVIAFLPVMMGWTTVAQHGASVLEFIRHFTNIIPFRGIAESVSIVLETGRIAYLTRYALNLFVLIPAGLLCGLNRRQLKDTAVQYSVVLMLIYGLRVILKLGSFDVDDILLNLLGLSMGWLLGNMIAKVVHTD